MKKVLVIGANSYIGKKFYEYSKNKEDHKMHVDMVTASDGAWRKTDLTGYDAILHLAAMVHKKEKKYMKDLYDEINHKLAVEVARKAKENKVGQFIFLSTAAVFGYGTSCITKDTVPKPVTYYGKSKLAAENDIMKLQDKAFKVAIVRTPMVYGDGCKGNYARLEKLARFTPIFPEYHNKRSVVHVANLSEYLANLIIEAKEGYFYPQDSEYLDTCMEIVRIRNRLGKRTWLVSAGNGIISLLLSRFRIIRKIFSDLYYNMD